MGDGATATGRTASHTYAAGGTYTITLTVTDDGGLSGSTNRSITVAAPSSVTVVTDSFSRSITNGWGSADTGGPYTITPLAESSYDVGNGVGTIAQPAGTGRHAHLGQLSERDVAASFSVGTDKVASGGTYGQTAALVVRRVATNTEYRARLRFAPGGGVFVGVFKLTGSSTELPVGAEVAATGLSHTAGARFMLKATVTGANPASFAVKVWPAGQAEPGGSVLNVTDGEPALQTGGAVGIVTYVSSAITNGPVLYNFDNFSVQRTGSSTGAAPPAPTNLVGTAISTTRIDLDWSPSTGATGYQVQRSENGGASWTTITSGVTASSYSDQGLRGFTTYAYRVRATNSAGASPYSNVVSVRTKKK